MPFCVGLDLGQSADYTALAVVQDVTQEKPGGGTERFLHLRHLERYPLRTLYPDIVEGVAALMRDPPPLPYGVRPLEIALLQPSAGAHRGQHRRRARCDRPPQEERS